MHGVLPTLLLPNLDRLIGREVRTFLRIGKANPTSLRRKSPSGQILSNAAWPKAGGKVPKVTIVANLI